MPLTGTCELIKALRASGVRNNTFKGSLQCLTYCGYLVSFGQSSGLPDPLPVPELTSKSLFLSRPHLMHYTATRDELLKSAGEVFSCVTSGALNVRVNHVYRCSRLLKLIPISRRGRLLDRSCWFLIPSCRLLFTECSLNLNVFANLLLVFVP